MGNPQVWQVAAGQAGRFYTDLFLKHDVMFMGPGRFGAYDSNVYGRAVEDGQATSGIVTNIANFCKNTKPGEIVLMRAGHQVKAIGIVTEGYEWNEVFDDVYGWDVQHARRVIWQEQLSKDLEQIQTKGPLFGERKQIPTFTRVNDEAILEPIRPLIKSVRNRALKPLPEPLPAPLSLDEIGQHLFARGLANEAVDKLIVAIGRQRRLQSWYKLSGEETNRPTEHEVVAHTVLPILIALGWSEQLLAVEWKKIDLAAFWGTPTNEKTCVLVCEAKSRNHGLQDVREQALSYVESLRLDSCGKVLLTDGGRFYLYERKSDKSEWSDKAVGYLNIEKIRTNHIAPPNTNAIDTIIALTPAAAERRI
jgi:hypothetical protein